MFQRLENGKVLVAKFTVDNKDGSKNYMENALSTCLASLSIDCLTFIQNTNYDWKHKYNNFISIEMFVQLLSDNIRRRTDEVELFWKINGQEIVIYISCSEKRYYNSTYSSKEFMGNIYGVKDSILDVDVIIDDIDRENYHWFNHPNLNMTKII